MTTSDSGGLAVRLVEERRQRSDAEKAEAFEGSVAMLLPLALTMARLSARLDLREVAP